MDPLQNLNPPAIHGEIVAGRAAEVRAQLNNLVGTIKEATFDMAALLVEAKKYATSWGFTSVIDFGVQELGLKTRKVQYLIQIVEVCALVGVKRADYEPVGISKMREICTLDPEGYYFDPEAKTNVPMAEIIADLIAEARDMTVAEVEATVRKYKGQTGDDLPVTKSYKTTKSAYENVISTAFEKARMLLGSAGRDAEGNAKDYSDGVCLEVICADWLADPNHNTPIPQEETDVNQV